MSEQCLEWAPFNLRPDVSEGELLRAADALQNEFLIKQPGFIRRQLLRAGDGSYVDILWWSSPEAAHAAMGKVAESSACSAYFDLMQVEQAAAGAGVALLTPVRSYG